MVNGKPGDHPVTDIVLYELPVFSPEVDALVREVDALGGFESVFASLYLLHASGMVGELRKEHPERAEGFLRSLRHLLEEERERLQGRDRES